MPTTAPSADVGLWYERYAASVRGAAARVAGDPDDADDALHDAFLAAWRARTRFDASREPLPWLLAIARRKALTIVQGRGPRAVATLPAPRHAPSAADEAIAREGEVFVRDALRSEPALALLVLDGLTLRGIGERLDVPLRTAASRVRRGRERLRAAFPATTPPLSESKAPWLTSS